MTTQVKICGITREEDARHAIQAGADCIGFVFYQKSKRCAALPSLTTWYSKVSGRAKTVGVFVNPTKEWVEAVLSNIALDVLQFHGDETEAFCASFERPYWKAIRVQSHDQLQKEVVKYPSADALLLDAYDEDEQGGTGLSFDWSLFPQTNQNIWLAGGLTSINVNTAMHLCHPFGLDVSSGVEASPGIKDHEKIDAFIKAVKGSDI